MPNRSLAWLKAQRHPGNKDRPVRFSVGRGLYLQITAANTRSWLFRFTRHGKAREMGLGAFDPDGNSGASLAAARRLADAAQRELQAGLDPIVEREKTANDRKTSEDQSKDHTFRIAAEGYVAVRRAAWRSDKHAAQWEATLQKHVYPTLGNKDVAEITIADTLGVLKPIWQKIPETASRVRQRVEVVLDYAAAPSRHWRSGENPARWRGVLEHELPPMSKLHQRKHHPSLPWQQMADFLLALEPHDGMAAQVIKFCVFTACRSNEARDATWGEIDLDAAIWSIPGSRMKGKKLHRVPLSKPAIRVLREMRKLASGISDGIVFPSSRLGRPLSDMSLSMLVRGMSYDNLPEDAPPRWRDIDGRAATVHGFRASFKGWSLAHGHPDHLGEIALAHADKDKVRAAYAREDMLAQRAPVMEAWGRFCTRPTATAASNVKARRPR